jgi:hypothetical protein
MTNEDTFQESNVAETFIFELKKLLPEDQRALLEARFDLSTLKNTKDFSVGYICAKWAIDMTSNSKNSEFKHLTAKIGEFLSVIKEVEWEAHFAMLDKMSPIVATELSGVNEALKVIQEVGKAKGFENSNWDQLVNRIIKST